MTIKTDDSQTTASESNFDLDGLMNFEDPRAELGELDFGDEVGGDEPPAPAPEPEPAPAPEPEDDADVADPDADPASEAEPEEAPAPVEDSAEADEADVESDADAAVPERDEQGRFKAKPKEPAIPKSRFDQRTAQLRAAERRAQELEEQLRTAQAEREQREREANTLTDEQISSKMAEANAAVIEGDTEKAAAIQSEIFKALRTQNTPAPQSAPIDRSQIVAEVREGMEFEQTVRDTFTRYPQLDPESEAHNEEVAVEAVAMQKMYFEQGYDRIEATRKAATAVAKIYGLGEAGAAPAPSEPPKAAAAKKMQQAARQAKVAAAQKAPPAAAGNSGAQRDSASDLSIHDVSPEDWATLPESVRNRMLGNEL